MKFTAQSLRTKSDAQLSALFNQASKSLKRSGNLSRAFNEAQAALHLIRQELQRRTPSP